MHFASKFVIDKKSAVTRTKSGSKPFAQGRRIPQIAVRQCIDLRQGSETFFVKRAIKGTYFYLYFHENHIIFLITDINIKNAALHTTVLSTRFEHCVLDTPRNLFPLQRQISLSIQAEIHDNRYLPFA